MSTQYLTRHQKETLGLDKDCDWEADLHFDVVGTYGGVKAVVANFVPDKKKHEQILKVYRLEAISTKE